MNEGVAQDQKLILMADDDQKDHQLIMRAIEMTGLRCNVHHVEDGEEAIHYLKGDNAFADRARYPLPQLLLCDIKMPKLTGFEVLQWLRRQKKLRDLPVIIMSSSNLPNDMQRAYQLGANQFFTKDDIMKRPETLGLVLKRFVSC
jgi:CheY-like chemotaxis protein